MAGFVLGTSDVSVAYVSLVFLPGDAGAALAQAALDDRRALALLGASYSANAYPFSLAFQNCNQWVAEMLALAWGDGTSRAETQQWLQIQGYEPTSLQVGPLMLLGLFVPWIPQRRPPAAGHGGRPLPGSACRPRWSASCGNGCRVRHASSCAAAGVRS